MTVTAAILLAASGRRIGGEPVALLPWREDETLIEYEVRELQAAGVDVIEVVLGDAADRVIPLVAADNVEPIVHDFWRDDPDGGPRIGATAVPRDTLAAVIVDVAQPRPATLYRALIEAHRSYGAPVTRLAAHGEPGWPVCVDAAVLAEIRISSAETGGLPALLERHAGDTRIVECGDAIVLTGIDSERAADALRAATR